MDLQQLKQELKRLVIEECQKEEDPASLRDDEILFGSGSRLALDSIDALQISLAVKQRYGKRIDAGNETRKALYSISTLAAFIAQ